MIKHKLLKMGIAVLASGVFYSAMADNSGVFESTERSVVRYLIMIMTVIWIYL